MKTDDNHTCDLCGLDIGVRPFYLERSGKRLQFCCEGCLGIYQMLHENEVPATPEAPAPPEGAINPKKRP
jgi:hypothetical protein